MGWSSQAIIASRVIVQGANDGVFVYNGTPGLNTLQASVTPLSFAGADAYGNLVIPGITYYKLSPYSGKYVAENIDGLDTFYYTTTAMNVTWVLQPGAFFSYNDLAVAAVFAMAMEFDNAVKVDGALTATGGTAASPTLITTDTWHTITLDAGWSTVAGYAAPQYRLLPDGNVQFAGMAHFSSTITAGQALNSGAPLPAAYRPASTKLYRGYSAVGTRLAMQIGSAGVLTANADAADSGAYAEIDGIVSLL